MWSSKFVISLALLTLIGAQPIDEPKSTKGSTIIKVKSDLKEKHTNDLELLHPEDNLVEPDPLPKVFLSDTLLPPPLVEPQTPEEIEPEHQDFPERQGFITGHRIPLELFSSETRENLDVDPSETVKKQLSSSTDSNDKYVDSTQFRRPSSPVDEPEARQSVPLPSRFVLPPFNINEGTFGLEGDRIFESTLDKFFPDSEYA